MQINLENDDVKKAGRNQVKINENFRFRKNIIMEGVMIHGKARAKKCSFLQVVIIDYSVIYISQNEYVRDSSSLS
jgi:hypothetical protein